MSNFIYYVPGVEPNKVDVKQLGLEYAFEGSPEKGYNRKGWDGEGGTTLLQRNAKTKHEFHPDEQKWKQYKGYWVGYWKHNPPTEEGLRRNMMLRGKSVRIRDQWWEIPIARSFEMDGEKIVPRENVSRYWDVNDDGEYVYGEIEEELVPLWDSAMRWWDFVYTNELPEEDRAEDRKPLFQTDVAELATTVLAFNYRIWKPELALLKLLSVDICRDIMNVTIDRDGLNELLDAVAKKNQPAESCSTTAGSAPVEGSLLLQT